MKKQFIISLLLLIGCVSGATATYEQINDTLYIYNATQVQYMCIEDLDTNIDKVTVVSGVCTEMAISIGLINDYDFSYDLNWAPNETMYYTAIVRIQQETIDSTLYGLYKNIKRTLYIDGNMVATYNTTSIINTASKNTFKFVSIDRRVHFGSKIVDNATLFFSELICDDQHDCLYNNSGYVGMYFQTCNEEGTGFDNLVLGGFTGIFMSGIKKIPFIGTSLYNVIFPVVTIMQYTIDFSFAFLNLIIYDWWYALMVLEIACMFIASQQNGYVNIVSAYFKAHVDITMAIYHKVIIPLITMFISLLNTIKNMIQWW
jgi:hypothetical protein